jgi:4-amino-4-deoxy-L-arabinose transferase-like glycosyltransferase
MADLRTRAVSFATRIDGISVRLGEQLLSPRVFLPSILFYLLLLFLIRGFLLPGGPNDDSEQLLYSQSFALGYGLRNPPLYTWLVIGAELVFGVTIAAVVAVKFLLLAGTYLLLFASGRHMASDQRWAVAAAAAPLGIYYIAWDAVQNYSHTVLLMFICAATHHCLLRLAERTRLLWYAALGLAIGIGIVTKYNYLLFAVSLIGAALTEPSYRRKLADRRIGVTVALAVLVAAPFLAYAIGHAGGERTGIPAGSLPNAALPLWPAFTSGLGRFLSFAIGFFVPLLFLAPAFFPRALRVLPADVARPGPALRMTGLSLLIQAVLFLLMFVSAYALGVGLPVLHPHLFFSFILLPLWFITRASYAGGWAGALPRFVSVLAVLAVVVLVFTLGKFVLDPVSAKRPVYNVPYATLASALRQAGFTGGTVYTWDQPFPLSGNLRVQFPDSRFITGKFPFYVPPARVTPGQCLAVWSSDGNAGIDQQAAAGFRAMTGADVAIDQDPSLVTLPMVLGWGRTITFKYRLFPEGVGSCR